MSNKTIKTVLTSYPWLSSFSTSTPNLINAIKARDDEYLVKQFEKVIKKHARLIAEDIYAKYDLNFRIIKNPHNQETIITTELELKKEFRK